MSSRLVIPRLRLSRCLGRLLDRGQTSTTLPLVQTHSGAELLLLVPGVRSDEAPPQAPRDHIQHLELSIAETGPAEWSAQTWPSHVLCRLWLGRAPGQAVLWGAVQANGGVEPLHELFPPGPGMERIRLAPAESSTALDIVSESDRERHSRTMGALGGEAVWLKLRGLSFTLIGCGRTGSLLASDLARLGIRHLTLVDPDRIEPHNLGEMDLVTAAHCGQPKAHSAAQVLQEIADPGAEIRSLPGPVQDEAALEACARADVLCCCADHDAARLAAAVLATLHHKVLLDIGTGIHFGQIRNPQPAIRNRRMGADVRLIVPGDGCLLCRGNLTQYARAVEDLVAHRPPATLEADWQRQRAGSLRSLNQMAVGLAVQMLQDLVVGRIRASLWAHLECDDSGRFTIAYPAGPADNRPCPLCARAGQGDGVLRSANACVTPGLTHSYSKETARVRAIPANKPGSEA